MTARDPELRIRFSRRADGAVVLHCTRRNGTTTWQRQAPRRAEFFALHDLRHFAAETTLGIHHGFFGLIADGWDIADTEGKGARGSLPSEAVFAEQLVGLLDRERIGGAPPLTAAEISAHLAQLPEPVAAGAVDSLTDERLQAIRVLTEQLHAAWAAAETDMELAFDRVIET
jgi:hypothetical protein